MKQLSFVLTLSLLITLQVSCIRSTDKCTRTIEHENYKILARYLSPGELVKSQEEFMRKAVFSQEKIDKVVSEMRINMEKQYLFAVTYIPKNTQAGLLSVHTAESHEEFSRRLRKILFSLENAIYITDKRGEKVYPTVYNAEQSFALSENRSVIYAFPRVDENGNKKLSGNKIKLVIDGFDNIEKREIITFIVDGETRS